MGDQLGEHRPGELGHRQLQAEPARQAGGGAHVLQLILGRPARREVADEHALAVVAQDGGVGEAADQRPAHRRRLGAAPLGIVTEYRAEGTRPALLLRSTLLNGTGSPVPLVNVFDGIVWTMKGPLPFTPLPGRGFHHHRGIRQLCHSPRKRTGTNRVDVRVVAATNRNLEEEVKRGNIDLGATAVLRNYIKAHWRTPASDPPFSQK